MARVKLAGSATPLLSASQFTVVESGRIVIPIANKRHLSYDGKKRAASMRNDCVGAVSTTLKIIEKAASKEAAFFIFKMVETLRRSGRDECKAFGAVNRTRCPT